MDRDAGGAVGVLQHGGITGTADEDRAVRLAMRGARNSGPGPGAENVVMASESARSRVCCVPRAGRPHWVPHDAAFTQRYPLLSSCPHRSCDHQPMTMQGVGWVMVLVLVSSAVAEAGKGGGHSSRSSSPKASSSGSSSSSHSVRGYAKKDGTSVASHRQTNADKTQRNNYSTKGNVNPSTGKAGTKNATH